MSSGNLVSDEILNQIIANKLMSEDTNLTFPSFPYGISKLAAEKAIMNMETKDFRPISLRKGTVGGWSPRMRFDLVVNAMTNLLG